MRPANSFHRCILIIRGRQGLNESTNRSQLGNNFRRFDLPNRFAKFYFEGKPKKLAGIRIVPIDAPETLTIQHRPLADDLDEYLDRLMDVDQFSGVVSVEHRGQLLYERAAGVKNQQTLEPITPQTTFQYASVGKMFTAVAIAQLVESHKLNFTDNLSKLLPEFDSSAAKHITVAQLLSHQSGMPDYFENIDRFKDVADSPSALQEFLKIFANFPLNFQPGDRFEYSNSNFLILGAQYC